MKQYPQVYEKITKQVPSQATISKIGSRTGSVDDLIIKFRDYFKELYEIYFRWVVEYAWLEHQYLYDGVGRASAQEAGIGPNQIYGYFMKNIVGVSQKPLSDNLFSFALSSYLPDFFPKLYDHNPFEEPEYFKFPYKNITISHLAFVYQCKERLEMLEYADERAMSYGDFRDWASNHVYCENPGEYSLCKWHNSSYLQKAKKVGRYKRKSKKK